MAELCQLYRSPVLAYLRSRGHPTEVAQDLTQGFFLHMLERDRFGRAEQLKGTFRGFLIGCLKHFEANERERRQALKRGGDLRFLSFDGESAEHRGLADGCAAVPADVRFDRQWALIVSQKALDRVRDRFGDDVSRYERLKGFLFAGEDPGSYESAARDLGLPVSLVRSAIHRLRRHYGDAVRAEIALTVSAPHEIDDEIRHLIGVLSAD